MNKYQELTSQLISLAPDLASKYATMNAEFGSDFTDDDAAKLKEIDEIHSLQSQSKAVGTTVVFENLLVPYILEISAMDRDSEQLSKIMNWLEELSSSNVFEISNLVAGSICEPLIASHEDKLAFLIPYMGTKMKELCKMQFSRFIVTEETKKMFLT